MKTKNVFLERYLDEPFLCPRGAVQYRRTENEEDPTSPSWQENR